MHPYSSLQTVCACLPKLQPGSNRQYSASLLPMPTFPDYQQQLYAVMVTKTLTWNRPWWRLNPPESPKYNPASRLWTVDCGQGSFNPRSNQENSEKLCNPENLNIRHITKLWVRSFIQGYAKVPCLLSFLGFLKIVDFRSKITIFASWNGALFTWHFLVRLTNVRFFYK